MPLTLQSATGESGPTTAWSIFEADASAAAFQRPCRLQLLGGFGASCAGVAVDLPGSTRRLAAFQRPCRLQLLGGFGASCAGVAVDLPGSTRRLAAFLALADRPLDRAYDANRRWMDIASERAYANLRTCLWRVRAAVEALVDCSKTHLSLRDGVANGARLLVNLARWLSDPGDGIDPRILDSHWFCTELLPDWNDDFVEIEREQLRQVRLQHAGRSDVAWGIALLTVAAPRLHKTARLLVIAISLDAANIPEAVRHSDSPSQHVQQHIGVGTSPRVRYLLESSGPSFGGHHHSAAADGGLTGLDGARAYGET